MGSVGQHNIRRETGDLGITLDILIVVFIYL